MNLNQYIGELLYEHDCVIIPGFGGIVTSYRSSFLNPAHHTFSPPSKKLAFNASLRNNDGLLANHLCNRLSVSYQEANGLIGEFVESSMVTLKDGEKLSIEKVGSLYLDAEHNLQFIPDTQVNYLKSSFGLYTIHSPAIKRAEKTPERVVFNPMSRSKRRSSKKRFGWRIIEVIPAAAVLLLLALYPSVIRKLNQQAASINPFDGMSFADLRNAKHHSNELLSDSMNNVAEYKKQNEFDLPPLDKDAASKKTVFDMPETSPATVDLKKEAPVISLKPEPVKDIPEKVSTVNNKKEEPEPAVTASILTNTKLYYVIGGCFSVHDNAINFRDQMIAEGFQASIIGTNEKGLHLVSLYSSPDKVRAFRELALIQEKAETKAWMMHK